jgi:hypothetical protein
LPETKLDEHPFVMRAEERRTWSSHSSDGVKPYALATLSLGKLSKVHIPSSAAAGPAIAARNSRVTTFFMVRVYRRVYGAVNTGTDVAAPVSTCPCPARWLS